MDYARSIFLFLFCCTAILFITFRIPLARADSPQTTALLLTVDGAIGPATDDYIHRGIKIGIKKHAEFIIMELDTPGGLDKSMRNIIKHILASEIPIITYVSPSGARAASAGTYIVYASHIAAMAPGTNIGAATPIQMGGAPTSKDNEATKTPENQKMTNDALAYIRSLAQLRNRNVEFAQEAVLKATSITAEQALKSGVVDFMAKNIPDLLTQINAKKITVLGKTVVLNTQHIKIIHLDPDWRSRVLGIITDPNIAYILLLLGIYGLFFELANPGFVLPGVIGGISILLALYAFQLLPINYAGLALIILGLAFLAAEAFMPSFGALGIGGIVAFIAGSILLIDPAASGYHLHWGLIISMALINAVFFFFIIGIAVRSRRRKIVTGAEELTGMDGIAMEDFAKEGWIRVHGESWRAQSEVPIKKNQMVRVVRINGLLLTVEPALKNIKIKQE